MSRSHDMIFYIFAPLLVAVEGDDSGESSMSRSILQLGIVVALSPLDCPLDANDIQALIYILTDSEPVSALVTVDHRVTYFFLARDHWARRPRASDLPTCNLATRTLPGRTFPAPSLQTHAILLSDHRAQ